MVIIDKEIAKWVMLPIGSWNESMTAIGDINSKGELVAGIAFENYNGNNLFGHQRIDHSPTRLFWITAADYIFNQCGCKRFTATVESDNIRAIRLNKHIGFVIEATLKNAGRKGDLIIMTLWRENCKFLNWVEHERNTI